MHSLSDLDGIAVGHALVYVPVVSSEEATRAFRASLDASLGVLSLLLLLGLGEDDIDVACIARIMYISLVICRCTVEAILGALALSQSLADAGLFSLLMPGLRRLFTWL